MPLPDDCVPLGECIMLFPPVSQPPAGDALDQLQHVGWKYGWKKAMGPPQEQLLRLAQERGIRYVTCTLCDSWHGMEHSTGPKHHEEVCRLKTELVRRGLGYKEGRNWFWQVVRVSQQISLRYNHLDGTIELWKPTPATRNLDRAVQLPDPIIPQMPQDPSVTMPQLWPHIPPPPPLRQPGRGDPWPPLPPPPPGQHERGGPRPPPPPPTDPWGSHIPRPCRTSSLSRALAQIQKPAAPFVASEWAFQGVLSSEADIHKVVCMLAQQLLDELRSRQAPLHLTFDVHPYSGDESQGAEQATASLSDLAVSGSGAPPARGSTDDWAPSASPACSIHPGFAQSGNVEAADSATTSAAAISSGVVRGPEPQRWQSPPDRGDVGGWAQQAFPSPSTAWVTKPATVAATSPVPGSPRRSDGSPTALDPAAVWGPGITTSPRGATDNLTAAQVGVQQAGG